MESRSLVAPQSSNFKLPIANLRNVFRPHEVERKLAKLPGKDHENLRTTYERMLERGPERFQVKPSGLPDMAALYEQLPNFGDALDDGGPAADRRALEAEEALDAAALAQLVRRPRWQQAGAILLSFWVPWDHRDRTEGGENRMHEHAAIHRRGGVNRWRVGGGFHAAAHSQFRCHDTRIS